MLIFEWLIEQPVEFFNVIVHFNLLFACVFFSLALSLVVCAREKRKKEVTPSNKTQPVSNSEATSKKTKEEKTSNSASTPNPNKNAAGLTQPSSGTQKDALMEEERGERKKHKKEEVDKKKEEEQRGSVRISIHGAAASSNSDGVDDEIYMQDIFDDHTARDDLFSIEARDRKKKRKKKSRATVPLPLIDSDRVDPTQVSSDQQPTVEPTEVTKEPATQTGYSVTQDQTECTRDTTKGGDGATTSERPAPPPRPQRGHRARIPSRPIQGRQKRSSDQKRNNKSSHKYEKSKTGETNTESTNKRAPRKKTSAALCKEPVADQASVTNKESARS